jgi:hypothetical protein
MTAPASSRAALSEAAIPIGACKPETKVAALHPGRKVRPPEPES